MDDFLSGLMMVRAIVLGALHPCGYLGICKALSREPTHLRHSPVLTRTSLDLLSNEV
jgi:hypothetical protein